MKKLVIFDLDGTLLNTIADLAAATNYALTQFGYPTHPTDAYRFFVGNGINKLFERALPEQERTLENVIRIRSKFVPLLQYPQCRFKPSLSRHRRTAQPAATASSPACRSLQQISGSHCQTHRTIFSCHPFHGSFRTAGQRTDQTRSSGGK